MFSFSILTKRHNEKRAGIILWVAKNKHGEADINILGVRSNNPDELLKQVL